MYHKLRCLKFYDFRKICALKLIDFLRHIIADEERSVEIDKSEFYRAKYKVRRRFSTQMESRICPAHNSKQNFNCTNMSIRGLESLQYHQENENNYDNLVLSYSLNLVNPRDPAGHTQNIEYLYRWNFRFFINGSIGKIDSVACFNT
ncbi:hypothetical protein RF11_10036 [Thelohanellus kitauei]|uniref:Uncharacterized protein n=1 Tax=Thelohanellus kitauei TaxID=669202 RepID=A0A0C2J4E8_THEKT|nr:hypothetical protein RF11_10036 [Thelohanellus kitauei]